MEKTINVGIFIFDEVEVLDFAGPFEVFSLTEDLVSKQKMFKVHTISENGAFISARNGLQVIASHTFENCPHLDVLIVPGGYGAKNIEIHKTQTLTWLKKTNENTIVTASICTGAFLLAKSQIITNEIVTTHWMVIEQLQNDFPELKVIKNVKYVSSGKFVSSAGISAGIDMSLFLVSHFCGEEVAKTTARRMDYNWSLHA